VSRRFRYLISSFLVGALSVGLAYAGSSLVPVDLTKAAAPSGTADRQAAIADGLQEVSGSLGANEGQGSELPPLGPGQVYAGAAKASTEPRPAEWGGTWEQSRDKCATLAPTQDAAEQTATHVADFRVKWAENPNCLYMGGYGIGPMNPLTSWEDPYGLWVRSVAVRDAQGDTVVLTILDGVYYFSDYNTMCDDCGWVQLAQELGPQLGIDPKSFMFATTHSHTSPDFIGGWGGVPQWYMDQVADAVRATVKAAVANLQPAVVETGEDYARQFSSERRDYYRSAEEDGLSWFRLLTQGDPEPAAPIGYDTDGNPIIATAPAGALDDSGEANGCENGEATGNPHCLRAIATVGSFANHPVTEDTESGTADADFPAVFDKRVEDLFGGVGLYFQTGFGNISPRDGGFPEGALEKERIGFGMASLLPELGDGRILDNTNVSSGQTFWDQPVTNSGLLALGLPGFFDRPFSQTPAAVSAGKNGIKNCKSASPVSVHTLVSAAKIGDVWITGGPGELFSNLSNTIKEKHPNGTTMPLSLVNDGLGYIMQSFETDHLGRQVTGFVGSADVPPDPAPRVVNVPIAEYEDAYSIDACFGDAVLENTLALLGSI
jgi:hypothetical protein